MSCLRDGGGCKDIKLMVCQPCNATWQLSCLKAKRFQYEHIFMPFSPLKDKFYKRTSCFTVVSFSMLWKEFEHPRSSEYPTCRGAWGHHVNPLFKRMCRKEVGHKPNVSGQGFSMYCSLKATPGGLWEMLCILIGF